MNTSTELDTNTLTPMMAQWAECKRESKEALLFFRLGDFYEAFYEDAEIISRELNLTFTERQGTPMCGVPWHTSEGYIDRLVAKGYRVAVAEQIETPRQTTGKEKGKEKGLMRRKVVRCISPGTQVASSLLDEKRHNFFASIAYDAHTYGLALIDVTTASFFVFECQDRRSLINELCRYQPKELLLTKRFAEREKELLTDIKLNLSLRLQTEDEWRFERIGAETTLCHHFAVMSLDGFGLKGMNPAYNAAGALLQHIRDTLMINVDHVKTISPQYASDTLFLDRATITNLELVEPLHGGKYENTLLHLIDESKTAMGARKLRQWLQAPLLDVNAIQARQDAVAELLELSQKEYPLACALDDTLRSVRDLERLVIRIQTGYAGPREYVALKASIEQLPKIKQKLSFCRGKRLNLLRNGLYDLHNIVSVIGTALVDNPPLRVTDGDLFRQGFHAELDEMRHLRKNSQEWLSAYQTHLRESTGIKTLKVGYTRQFGYYIEVSRGQSEKMPDCFLRRQTLVNGERYISQELKEYEEKILSADERIATIESVLFAQLQRDVAAFHPIILQNAAAVAEIDALRALSIVAEKRNYCRPQVDASMHLCVEDGRHPIIEALSTAKQFIPNDIDLDGEARTLMLITGPNMAGKSTYIRQIALIVILAQIGSFIPAKRARIGVIDKLFSRIGASDDLARGQSTFMVEMAETASILHQATSRSLVILDEIGRGTSTYDGISIAWAVAEYLLEQKNKRAKTLFATHYYELTELEKRGSGALNYTVAVAEMADDIRFLHKIVRGKTDRSYGIHVARIAGLPTIVIERAQALLQELEQEKRAQH